MAFNIDKYAHLLKTDKPFFWHGQSTDKNGRKFGGSGNAARIAELHGGKTIKMCLIDNMEIFKEAGVEFLPIERKDGSTFYRINYGSSLEERDKFWILCAIAFTFNSEGNVHCSEGTDKREGGIEEYEAKCIYNNIEVPIMHLARNVQSITKVDPVLGQQKEIITLAEEFKRIYGTISSQEVVTHLITNLEKENITKQSLPPNLLEKQR